MKNNKKNVLPDGLSVMEGIKSIGVITYGRSTVALGGRRGVSDVISFLAFSNEGVTSNVVISNSITAVGCTNSCVIDMI